MYRPNPLGSAQPLVAIGTTGHLTIARRRRCNRLLAALCLARRKMCRRACFAVPLPARAAILQTFDRVGGR